MENNPYYNENQAWMHPGQDAQATHLQQLQTHWYEQQEADRQHAFDLQSTQNDFANLQGAAQQFGPHPHHHNGPGWGGVAAGALAGYYLANRQQRFFGQPLQQQPIVQRPEGWKSNVLWIYITVAAVVHVMVWMVSSMSDAEWFAVGTIFWIPAWFFGIRHQIKVSRHNKALQQN